MKQVSTMKQSTEGGFTLVELLIGVAVAGLVGALIATAFSSYQSSFTQQNQVATVQEDVGGALYLVEKETRMAGYDPTQHAGAGVLYAMNSTLSFSADYNGDGDINGTERITYALYDYVGIDGASGMNRSDLGRRQGNGAFQLVARNIDTFIVEAFDSDGNQVFFWDDVAWVRLLVEGTSERDGKYHKRSLDARIVIRNANL